MDLIEIIKKLQKNSYNTMFSTTQAIEEHRQRLLDIFEVEKKFPNIEKYLKIFFTHTTNELNQLFLQEQILNNIEDISKMLETVLNNVFADDEDSEDEEIDVGATVRDKRIDIYSHKIEEPLHTMISDIINKYKLTGEEVSSIKNSLINKDIGNNKIHSFYNKNKKDIINHFYNIYSKTIDYIINEETFQELSIGNIVYTIAAYVQSLDSIGYVMKKNLSEDVKKYLIDTLSTTEIKRVDSTIIREKKPIIHNPLHNNNPVNITKISKEMSKEVQEFTNEVINETKNKELGEYIIRIYKNDGYLNISDPKRNLTKLQIEIRKGRAEQLGIIIHQPSEKIYREIKEEIVKKPDQTKKDGEEEKIVYTIEKIDSYSNISDFFESIGYDFKTLSVKKSFDKFWNDKFKNDKGLREEFINKINHKKEIRGGGYTDYDVMRFKQGSNARIYKLKNTTTISGYARDHNEHDKNTKRRRND